MVEMKVVILCGGEGTRLREETEYKPKPMVTIGGMPILWHIMKIYSNFGFREFVLCLGYKGEMIRQFFLNHELMSNDVTITLGDRSHDYVYKRRDSENWTITFADTGLKSGTGSRLKRIEKYVDSDYFLATYGDAVSDIDIASEIKFHNKNQSLCTLAGVHPHSKFGLLKADSTGLISSFEEKPALMEYVNGGFYVFQKEVFDYLETDESCILETKPFSSLVSKKKMRMFRHDGFWHSMDTYKDYLDLNRMWEDGRRPWKKWKD